MSGREKGGIHDGPGDAETERFPTSSVPQTGDRGVESPSGGRLRSTVGAAEFQVSRRSPGETPGAARGAPLPFRPFRSPSWLAAPFAQTTASALLPVWYPRGVPAPIRQVVAVRGGDRLSLFVTPGPTAPDRSRGRLLLLHGLAGSVQSGYMLRTLAVAHHRGWEVARLNFRGAGRDGDDAPGFHNAGRSEDVDAALEQVRWSAGSEGSPLATVGFSLGGAVLLKYLGEKGGAARLSAAAALCPPLDLALCLGALERPENRLYHLYYVYRMRKQIAPKLKAHPGLYPPLDGRARSVRALDALYTAPDAGYPSAESYYAGASCLPLLESIRVPSLLLGARDDPFIPESMLRRASRLRPALGVVITEGGGHLGFLERRGRGVSFWAARAVIDWLESVC